MSGRVWSLSCLVLLGLAVSPAAAVERFRPPDFTEHQLPETTTPEPPAPFWDYLDLGVPCRRAGPGHAPGPGPPLAPRPVGALRDLAGWLGFRRDGLHLPDRGDPERRRGGGRSDLRRAVFGGGLLRPADPGCPVLRADVLCGGLPAGGGAGAGRRAPGAHAAVAGPLPWGFCPTLPGRGRGVCDHGGRRGPGPVRHLQVRPVRRLLPHERSATMLALGLGFLVLGLFVGRPYCRYLCPYGAILRLCSRVSKRHVRIPPEECIKCRLCEDACPYGAIREPTVEQSPRERLKGRRRLAVLLAVFPLVVAVGAVLGHFTGRGRFRGCTRGRPWPSWSPASPATCRRTSTRSRPSATPRRPPEELYAEARALHGQFGYAGAWLGGWVGLVIGVKLVYLSIRRRRDEYQPDRGNCVSCGRCFWYCPEEQVRLGLIEPWHSRPRLCKPQEQSRADIGCLKHSRGRLCRQSEWFVASHDTASP